MIATAFLVLTISFELQTVISISDQSTNDYTERTTKPTNDYNPLEHILLNQNENKQDNRPIANKKVIEQITNPTKHIQSSTESNIEKIPPNNANQPSTNSIYVERSERNSPAKALARVKRQFFPYPVYRRPCK